MQKNLKVSCRVGFNESETMMPGVITGRYYDMDSYGDDWIEVKLDTGSIHYFRQDDIIPG